MAEAKLKKTRKRPVKADALGGPHRFSVSLINQGNFKFYSFTVPSDVLARNCFVTTRDEDNQVGFQRVLDKKRAQEIAAYVDSGQGSIPTAVVLSAQPDAEFELVDGGKTISFKEHPKAFLVLDGQHRVYGFSLAETSLRVPVVVYNNLTREEETRLFIDINTRQKPVPAELLLDIKNLANYETDKEAMLREVFDLVSRNKKNALLGIFSPHKKASGKISRVTFNSAVGPLINTFGGRGRSEIANIFTNYYLASISALRDVSEDADFTNPIVFKALHGVFSRVAQRVKDKYSSEYRVDTFYEILSPMLSRVKINQILHPGKSHKELTEVFKTAMTTDFSI